MTNTQAPAAPLDLSVFEGHTPGPWSVPHFADDTPLPVVDPALLLHSSKQRCMCGYVFGNDDRMGAVATVHFCGEKQYDRSDGNPPMSEALVNARLIAAAPALLTEVVRLREALQEIGEGRGPFSVDQLTFAGNTIEAMKQIANAALACTLPPSVDTDTRTEET